MTKKKEERLDDWVSAAQAAEIISERSGKAVSRDYVRKLVQYGKLETKKLSERVVLYSRASAEKIVVESRGGKHHQDHSPRTVRKNEEAVAWSPARVCIGDQP